MADTTPTQKKRTMRLTQHTDYALRVLIFLGLKSGDLATIQEISESYNISRNHLMKVVQKLAHNGYIETTRGVGGGIRLSSSPEAINLGDVVGTMEADAGLVECLRPENACVITPACSLASILKEAAAAFSAELSKHTLADLLPANKRKEFYSLLRITNNDPETQG